MKTTIRPLLLVLGCALSTLVHADNASVTLDRIRAKGVITLGVRESSVPFSYYDQDQRTIGYSQDIALKIAEAIKKDLNLPQLKLREIPITSQNRIPLVQNGTIDFECGSTTHTKERDKQVTFSNSFFQYGMRLLVRKNSGIKDFPDLAGKTVATTAGTTEDRLLRQWNEEKRMRMSIIAAKDHAEAFMNVTTGRAVGFFMDEPLLYGAKAKEANSDDYVVIGTSPVSESYGCMLRKDDMRLKKIADGVIAQMQRSGEAQALYTKWFMRPIPPKGMNLNYPLSDDMKRLFANPNDLALD
jgi:ABC-type amino acid transport substrate-binding protein